MFLERDGTNGGLRVRTTMTNPPMMACTDITSTGSILGFNANSPSVTTQTVVSNAQNVVSYDCRFGHTFTGGQHTQARMSREDTDSWWYGFLRSTSNQ